MKHSKTVLAYQLRVENPKAVPVSDRQIVEHLAPFVAADQLPTVVRRIRNGDVAVSSLTHNFRAATFG